MADLLDNPRSPRVRAVAKLAKRSARRQSGLFLLEGPQAVAEALGHGPQLLVELYATPAALERHIGIAEAAVEAGVDLELVTEQVLDAMADTVTPQGVVAVCHQFPTSVRDVFAGTVRGAPPRLIAILEEVRDPGNAGTIVRTADAAGADGVVFTGSSVDLYNPKVVRATTGSIFHIPVAGGAALQTVLDRAREAGMQVFAADVKGEDLVQVRHEGRLAAPTAWLFGNEARGLSDDHLTLADRVVRVPVYGAAESMNLSTAASVCLYESAFEQHDADGRR
jgi:TrmH family RNA methyltransferase